MPLSAPIQFIPLARLLALLVAVLLLTPRPAAAITDEEVDAAIDRLQKWLFSQQDRDTGVWKSDQTFPGPDDQAHGETAIVTLALLASGVSPQDPRIDRALAHLREAEMDGTYAVAVRAHVWAALPDRYLANLGSDAQWLMEAQRESVWDYGPKRNTRVDHSTTQYGLLGLWEFSKRGGRVPREIWQDAVDHFLKAQGPDGGWAYNLDTSRTSGSMTAAGLTVLYIAVQELARDRDGVPADIRDAIQKGLTWLDQNYSPSTNPGRNSDYEYYLYGIERVALASGVKTFGGKDWFETGAEALIRKEKGRGHVGAGHGGPLANAAFALMFLSRGRVPVWMTKLEVPDADWNRWPNDVYFLTQHLSDIGEQEINWQTVSLDLPPEQYLNAPVAYLSASGAVTLTDRQKAHLREFIDRGGLLIASAAGGGGGGGGFVPSMQRLAAELYPDHPLQPMPADHALLTALYRIDAGAARGLQMVSNGARDLMIVTPEDWSRSWQTDTDPGDGAAWRIATNLYTLVTDRGTLENRLAQKAPERESRAKKGEITWARAQYDGAWNIEPRAWEPLNTIVFNASGYELQRVDTPLEEIGSSPAALVHLAGVERVELTDAQLQAIRRYVEQGGTVLVETIGGRGAFSVGVEAQLQRLFGAPATPLSSIEPILSGRGIAGGGDARRVLYRPYSVIRLSARNTPRLAAFTVDGRPAVLVSHEDLSLGATGLKRWGVNGYQPESARQLLTNVLLAAFSVQKP